MEVISMRFFFRTSRRTGVSLPAFPLIFLVFLWPLLLIYAVWKFVGDKSIPSGLRFVVGFGFWCFMVLAVSGQIR
jgi:hypothetical protein